jgi:hypothetical protein
MIKSIGEQSMPDKSERPRGRVRTRTVLLAGGAASVVAAAIALSGAATVRPAGQQGSSPQAVNARRDITGHDVAMSSLPWHKSSIASTFPAPVSVTLPRRRTGERDDGRGDAKQMGAARNRASIHEPHGHPELQRPRPLAVPAADRHTPQPSPRAKRPAKDPRPASPGTTGRRGSPSLIAMKCDELFPPHKREFRLRNIACHRLLD